MADKKQTSSENLNVDIINAGIYAEKIGATTDLKPISREDAFDFFDKASDQSFESLSGGDYLNWEEMQRGKYVFIFTGTTTWVDNTPKGQGKTVTAVKLEDREGKEWICAAKLIVDALMKVQQVPCMIRVIYNGKKTAKSGNNFFDLNIQVPRGAVNPAASKDGLPFD